MLPDGFSYSCLDVILLSDDSFFISWGWLPFSLSSTSFLLADDFLCAMVDRGWVNYSVMDGILVCHEWMEGKI